MCNRHLLLQLFMTPEQVRAMALGESILAAASPDAGSIKPQDIALGQGPVPPSARPLGGTAEVPSEFPMHIFAR